MQSVRTGPSEQALTTVDSVMNALMSVGRLMRQRGQGESFDPSTFWLLKTIGHRGATRITELAGSANLDTSTVSRHVAQLERAGLVARQPDPDDGRAQLVDLTDEGRDHFEQAFHRRRELLTRSFSGWSEAETCEFQRLLAKFVAAIDTNEVDPT